MRLVSRYRRMELGLVGFNASNKTTPRANLMSAVTPIADIAIYSITASARASTAGGIVRPSALAVLRLITRSYLVGACTGKG